MDKERQLSVLEDIGNAANALGHNTNRLRNFSLHMWQAGIVPNKGVLDEMVGDLERRLDVIRKLTDELEKPD